MKSVDLSNRLIGPTHEPYVIAELSCNHNGSLDRAIAIVDAAAAAGADAVKLQTYTADSMTIDYDGPGFVIEGGLWRGHKLYDLYKAASTPWEWHAPLFQRGWEKGITVFSSPFDACAVDFLEELNSPAYKIASFEAVDLPLIKKAAETGKPLILSTGMANDDEIADALSAAQVAGSGKAILLHCVSAYPAPVADADLLTIPDMMKRFDVPVGLSDHTLGTAVAIAAVALGACVIEKHLTLARADGGFDAPFSLEPHELATLVQGVRDAWQAIGRAGYDRKQSEAGNASLRRSLYVVEDIPAGGLLTKQNVRSIRPGRGLAPKFSEAVLGRRAARDLLRGAPLDWEMLEDDG